MTGQDIFGALFGMIDNMGLTIIEQIYQAFATALGPVFVTGMTIYIAWFGYGLIMGRAGLSPGTVLMTLGRMGIIYSLAYSWTTFSPLIAQTALAIPSGVGQVICQAASQEQSDCTPLNENGTSKQTSNGTTQGLTAIWNAGMTAGTKISAAGGWTGVGLVIAGIAVMIIVGLLVAVASALLILSQIALFVTLATAPLFISAALFGFTSSMFSGWMNSLLQYAIALPTVVYGILGVMLIFIRTQADSLVQQQEFSLQTVAPFVVLCAMTTYLLLQSQNIAQGIAGGARIDASRMLNDLRRGSTAAARQVGNLASKAGNYSPNLSSARSAEISAARKASRS